MRRGRARALYRRLLEQTQHVKVWLSFARFEHETAHSDASARAVLRDADACFRAAADTPLEQQQQRDARALVAETALSLEREIGDPAAIAAAQARLPQRVRRRRALQAADGADAGWEEYWEYVFPGEDGDPAAAAAAAASPALRLLERARLWKRQRLAAAESTSSTDPVTVKTEDSVSTGNSV